MKKCPFCAEEIQDAAIKCKHCGEMLSSPPALGWAVVPPPQVNQGPCCAYCSAPVSSAIDAPCPACGKLQPVEGLTGAAAVTANGDSWDKQLDVPARTPTYDHPLNRPLPDYVTKTIFVALALIVIVPILIYLGKQSGYGSYKAEADKALAELEKINAATETGINYSRYGEKIADANFVMRRFKEWCNSHSSEYYDSYKSITLAFAAYVEAQEAWKEKFDTSSESRKADAESKLQSAWSRAGGFVRDAKRELGEGR